MSLQPSFAIAGRPRRQYDSTDPAWQRNAHVRIGLDAPAHRRELPLESAVSRLQGRVWINRRRLLARRKEHAPSDQFATVILISMVYPHQCF